jgi:thiol-disulfide isomerase/thioredoxin
MLKSNKKYRRKQAKGFPWMPIVLGTSLIGMAVLALASPGSAGNAADLSSVVPLKVDFAAPDLSLQNINGETESLRDFREDVVLVNNWATWCPPCKAEMPTLAAYYNEHTSQGFTIIAIEAGDAIEGVAQFAQSGTVRYAWTGEISRAMLEKYVTPLLDR